MKIDSAELSRTSTIRSRSVRGETAEEGERFGVGCDGFGVGFIVINLFIRREKNSTFRRAAFTRSFQEMKKEQRCRRRRVRREK